MKISFIATVLNEEKTIDGFIKSIFWQSRIPDEIIIVDGGSSDRTVTHIPYPISNIKNKKILGRIRFKIIIKKGNRAVGRNEAIKQASGETIVCSDAGCILDKNWIKEVIEPFKNREIDVVAGYYKGIPRNSLERCIVPYFLVMEDRINPDNFLPATRSMAFRKSIWQKVGGFDEGYSHNEDYVFSKKLKRMKAKIVFNKNAIVYWLPKKNLKEAFISFYRFAKGDAESRIFRPKVTLLFMRYFVGLFLLFSFIILKTNIILNTIYLILILYFFWSVAKNFKYVKAASALYYLPIIQIASDIAVLMGTIVGLWSIKHEK